MEQFNQQRQDIERNNREAVMSDLASRGLRSGAAEQTAMLNSQQELGRQSVLAALGAQSNAIGRSQQAMQGWSQASQAGRAAQLQAQGMYVDAAGNLRQMNDQVGMFNTAEANTTSRHNSAMQTQTNQFNAGQTNNARANHQATRLAGAQGFADVETFNAGQQNLIGINNQQTQLQDLIRKQSVNTGQLGDNVAVGQTNFSTRTGVNATNAGRDEKIHGLQQEDIDLIGTNARGLVGTNVGYEGAQLSGRNSVSNEFEEYGDDWGGVFTGTTAQKKKNKDDMVFNMSDFATIRG